LRKLLRAELWVIENQLIPREVKEMSDFVKRLTPMDNVAHAPFFFVRGYARPIWEHLRLNKHPDGAYASPLTRVNPARYADHNHRRKC